MTAGAASVHNGDPSAKGGSGKPASQKGTTQASSGPKSHKGGAKASGGPASTSQKPTGKNSSKVSIAATNAEIIPDCLQGGDGTAQAWTVVGEVAGANHLGATQGELFCFCRQPENMDMIACDICEQWFHAMCFGINLVSLMKNAALTNNFTELERDAGTQ